MIGDPNVTPFSVPDRISTLSVSDLCVVNVLWPGLRRSSCGWMSSSVNFSLEGQPSTTAPTQGPCDSPKVVIVKQLPKLLDIDIPFPSEQSFQQACTIPPSAAKYNHEFFIAATTSIADN